MRRSTSCAALLGSLLFAASLAAQTPSPTASADPQAAELIRQSLVLLHQGEQTISESERRSSYERGLELAVKAVELDPGSAEAHWAEFANRGRLMWMQGVFPSLIHLFRLRRSLNRTLDLDPNHSGALTARGAMYRELPGFLGGDLDKSQADLERAMALDPSSIATRLHLARTYLEAGKREQALPLIEAGKRMARERNSPNHLADAEELSREAL
ncbi:MAG TPA: tetratricopeptide repeat protein [Terriglobales bacterium]|nr:tetratricopeptide repeat protein [Terriglobales bacterium]